MNKLFVLLVVIFQSFVVLHAQQDPLNSQYMFNGMIINPAFAGQGERLNIAYMYRRQWTSIPNSPLVQNVSINTPISYQRIGLGLQFVNERIHIQNNLSVNASCSYKINFANGTLAFGINAGFKQMRIDVSDLEIKDVQDKLLNQPTLMLPDLGAGLLYSDKSIYVGVSMLHLIPGSGDIGLNNTIVYNQVAHYYLMGGYKANISENIQLIPSIILRYVPNTPIQADITIHAMYKQICWAGVSWRTAPVVAFQAGFKFSELLHINQSMKIGYSYDLGYGGIAYQLGGSHELMLIFDLAIHPSPEKIKKRKIKTNPVFF